MKLVFLIIGLALVGAPADAGADGATLRAELKRLVSGLSGLDQMSWWGKRRAVKRYKSALMRLTLHHGPRPSDWATRQLWKGLWEGSDELARSVGLRFNSQLHAVKRSATIIVEGLHSSRSRRLKRHDGHIAGLRGAPPKARLQWLLARNRITLHLRDRARGRTRRLFARQRARSRGLWARRASSK